MLFLFLLCFVLIVFMVCLFVVLVLHHLLTTFRTVFKTAVISFMVVRPFTLKKVKYIDQLNNTIQHVFDFTSSRIGTLVCDWFVVNIKIYTNIKF